MRPGAVDGLGSARGRPPVRLDHTAARESDFPFAVTPRHCHQHRKVKSLSLSTLPPDHHPPPPWAPACGVFSFLRAYTNENPKPHRFPVPPVPLGALLRSPPGRRGRLSVPHSILLRR